MLTASRITDPACGYRAVRTQALSGLEFQARTSFTTRSYRPRGVEEETADAGVPVTVETRISGLAKKPSHFRYELGFANALVRAGRVAVVRRTHVVNASFSSS